MGTISDAHIKKNGYDFRRPCVLSPSEGRVRVPSGVTLSLSSSYVHWIAVCVRPCQNCVTKCAGSCSDARELHPELGYFANDIAALPALEQRNSPQVSALRGQLTTSGDLPSQGIGQAGQSTTSECALR